MTKFSRRILLGLLIIFGSSTFNQIYSQSNPDSLELYDPFIQMNQIRALLMNDFSELGFVNSQLVEKYKSQIPDVIGPADKQNIALIYTNIGDIYIKAGKGKNALDNFFSALTIYEELKDSVAAAVLYLKIGKAYLLGEIVLKTDYIGKGYEVLKNSPVPELRAYALYVHTENESDPAKIDALLKEALFLQLKAIKENPTRTDLSENLSKYYNALGEFDKAIEVARKINNNWLEVMYLNNYGYQKATEGKYEEALKLYFKARGICYKDRLKGLLKNTFNDLADVYKRMGDLNKAVRYLRYAYFIEESLHREDFQLYSADLKVKFDTDKKDEYIEVLNESNKNKLRELSTRHSQAIILFLLLTSIIIIATILFISRKRLLFANKLLNENAIKLEILYAGLNESEINLNAAQEIANFANWEFTSSDNKFTFSKHFSAMFNIPEKDLNAGFREVLLSKVHPEDRLSYLSVLETINSSSDKNEIDYRVIVDDGIKWIRAKFAVFRKDSGDIAKISGTVQDITAIQKDEEIKIKAAAQESFMNQLLEFQEQEKKRIAGEIHDSLGQEVLAIKNAAQLFLINEKLDTSTSAGFKKIDQLSSMLLNSIRNVAFQLLPLHLEILGVTQTIKDNIARISETNFMNIKLELDDIDEFLSPEAQLNLFRIVQEGLNNILKHSEATNATVLISESEKSIQVTMSDDGKGFTQCTGQNEKTGFGAMFMQKRVEMLKGELKINSTLNGGTKIEITIPKQQK